MIHALASSLLASLLLAAICRASRAGGLLAGTVGQAWQWWLIKGRGRLPGKVTGDCILCTTFWLPGIPVAVAVAATGGGWWGLVVPFCVAVLSEILILL